MRFETEREKQEFIRKIRNGRPILVWKEHPNFFLAKYRSLFFYIYKEIHSPYTIIEPEIILYLDTDYARGNRGRYILRRAISQRNIPLWMKLSDELLFKILSGKVKIEVRPHIDDDDYDDDIFDSL